MTVAEAIVAIPLWVAAGAFVAVVVTKIVRGLARPENPESPYDL